MGPDAKYALARLPNLPFFYITIAETDQKVTFTYKGQRSDTMLSEAAVVTLVAALAYPHFGLSCPPMIRIACLQCLRRGRRNRLGMISAQFFCGRSKAEHVGLGRNRIRGFSSIVVNYIKRCALLPLLQRAVKW
jgi:hypothetical protein